MTSTNITLLLTATVSFIAAASAAKSWATSGGAWVWLFLTLALYTFGNLLMLRLVRDLGMGIAFSLSAIAQLLAINLLALAVFGERVSALQGAGIVLALIAVALITLPAGR
ncbi:hypothetical protein [Chelativorans salis]|uniref:EamA domain-containing protein n=1 Tax=Chelativorans salis TaxID=2978478 RepID=A0ABT2LU24_9HYPH|nr:hypothetical protein [Chelativorans sp. EGI FJ00035]MCT7378022.1 hypothetical protein [Chelativorans sp. EGI FJ00035]